MKNINNQLRVFIYKTICMLIVNENENNRKFHIPHIMQWEMLNYNIFLKQYAMQYDKYIKLSVQIFNFYSIISVIMSSLRFHNIFEMYGDIPIFLYAEEDIINYHPYKKFINKIKNLLS